MESENNPCPSCGVVHATVNSALVLVDMVERKRLRKQIDGHLQTALGLCLKEVFAPIIGMDNSESLRCAIRTATEEVTAKLVPLRQELIYQWAVLQDLRSAEK